MGGVDPRMGGEDPRMGWTSEWERDPLEWGGQWNPKIGSRTSSWYQFYTIGTNVGLYGLELSAFILTFRDDPNGSTPEGPRPLI